MAYTPQTWVDNSVGADGQVTATRLNYMEAGIEEAHLLAAGGGGGGSSTQQYLTVASSQLPLAIRSACDYVCDGVNDQIEINTALRRASRPADGFTGAEGRIGVALVGPTFFVGQSTAGLGAGAITMYPSTGLYGAGQGSLIIPQWTSNVDRGAIELVNENTAHVRVSNLTIGNTNTATVNGHGIKFVNAANAGAYDIQTGSDPFQWIDHVNVLKVARSGFFVTGTAAQASGNRETQISHCLAWQSQERGFYIDSSDCQVSDCRATGGQNFPRFAITGGNTKVANSKAYFSGNQDVNDGPSADGFLLSSSRLEIVGCSAQDCGRNGFAIQSTNVLASSLVADSNSRGTPNGAGIEISGNGVYEGMHAHNRPQTPSSPQQVGIRFVGSPNVYVSGRTAIEDTLAGASHIVGTPGANSFVRIVRQNSTIYSVG